MRQSSSTLESACYGFYSLFGVSLIDTKVLNGKSVSLIRDVECEELLPCRSFTVNRRESPIFWFFQDVSYLLLSRRIAQHNGWGVRAYFWNAAKVAAYWQQNWRKWTWYLDVLDAHEVDPIIYVDGKQVEFAWFGPAREGWFGDTVPPCTELVRWFDDFVDGLCKWVPQ